MTTRIAKHFLIVLQFLSFGIFPAGAQVSSASSVSARIVTPIAIPQNVNSEFGNVAVIISGMVEISAVTAAESPSAISLPVGGGTFTAAAFYFAGPNGYAFTVNTPKKPLVVQNKTHSVLVSSFESTPVQDLQAGVISGVYISVSPSKVTVNYN